MWINAKNKLATTVFVAACLILTQLEPAAWGKSVQNNPPAAPPAQGQTAPPATPPAQAADAPAKADAPVKKKSKKLKWLLIGAAAVGAAAGFLLIKNRKKAEPTVTLGGPTVGNPQ